MEAGVEYGASGGKEGILEGRKKSAGEVLNMLAEIQALSSTGTHAKEYVGVDEGAENAKRIEHAQNESYVSRFFLRALRLEVWDEEQ